MMAIVLSLKSRMCKQIVNRAPLLLLLMNDRCNFSNGMIRGINLVRINKSKRKHTNLVAKISAYEKS
jgi:hypothetical protein